MEKKYYDLIITLIKEHKKFSGYEPLLEDIAKDVYERANVILGTVTNEDVISSYINKIIPTSIISLSKKMDYNNRVSHKVIINEPQVLEKIEYSGYTNNDHTLNTAQTDNTEATNIEPAEENETIENSFNNEDNSIALNIEETEEIVLTEDIEPEAFSIENEGDESLPETAIESVEADDNSETIEEYDNSATFELEEEEQQQQEQIIEEPVYEIESSTLEDDSEIEKEVNEKTVLVDKTLVDKMINGISETEKEDVDDIQEEGLTTDLEQEFDLESLDDLDINEDEDFELNINSDELVDEAENSIEEPVLSTSDEIIEEFDNNDFDLEEDESASIDIQEPEDLEIENGEINQSFVVPNYDLFKFDKSEDFSYNEDEISSDLISENNKHPEKQVLKICRLKYYENKTVSEIAEMLNTNIENVLETLNTIIDLVKD